MNCELLATCSALGFLEEDVYHKEPDCLGNAQTTLLKEYQENVFEFNNETLSCDSHVCNLLIIESVKDLIRYLRHEDDTRDIRQQLGAGQILQNDLLPIITQHTQDKPLFDACIRCVLGSLFF